MIFNETGNWSGSTRCRRNVEATNLQVQQLDGQPVLTWWQGYIPPQGFGEGEEIIENTYYQLSSAASTRATATRPTCTTSTSPPRTRRC